jgi:lipopolysaccharide transport system ATP-binding protein
MSDTVIKVENLGKKYLISHLADKREQLFSRLLVNKAKTAGSKVMDMFRSAGGGGGGEHTTEEFWALKDVSFEIKQGDRVGIIGRNGAGKSTLLKVLSRITEPTKGRITIDGRVASLLEVGTGFHSELTGRENIYLNGAILGMSREEIRRKFDEIVAFAEVEQFLDTPVKRYSSGMYVRLAFAVAAHLEPEILIVDEVLAVGDAQFQKKCLGKMEEVSTSEGRTVLFVSHQMGAIAQLCNKALLLDKGELIHSGAVNEVVNHYMNESSRNLKGYEIEGSLPDKEIVILKAQTFDAEGNIAVNFAHNQEIKIIITYKVNKWVNGSAIRVAVRDSKRNVFTTDTEETETFAQHSPKQGELCASVVIPAGLLRPEHYFFTLSAYLPNQVTFNLVRDALSITVYDGGSKYAASEWHDYGCVFVDCKWSVENVS